MKRPARAATQPAAEETYSRGLARASAGALIFSFPLLMTMEMWAFGIHMDRVRLALFLLVTLAVVFGLSGLPGSGTRPMWPTTPSTPWPPCWSAT